MEASQISRCCASIYPPGTSQPAWPMRTRTSGCPFMVRVLHLTFSNHPLPFHHSYLRSQVMVSIQLSSLHGLWWQATLPCASITAGGTPPQCGGHLLPWVPVPLREEGQHHSPERSSQKKQWACALVSEQTPTLKVTIPLSIAPVKEKKMTSRGQQTSAPYMTKTGLTLLKECCGFTCSIM